MDVSVKMNFTENNRNSKTKQKPTTPPQPNQAKIPRDLGG
jgi:hypothetical protein